MKDSSFNQWFLRTSTDNGVITRQEGWKNPVTGEKWIDELMTRQMDTRENAIKEALIELGWTPPGNDFTCQRCKRVLPKMKEGRFSWICEACEAQADDPSDVL